MLEGQPHGGALKRTTKELETEEVIEQRWLSAKQQQEQRLKELPPLYRQALERLAYELALNMEPEQDTFKRHGYSIEEAQILIDSALFKVVLARVEKDVSENGLSFKAKAGAQAEELLAHSFEMATDPYVSAAVRADIIQWTARMAGYEPNKNVKDEGKGGSGGINLHLTFTQVEPLTVGHQPITIEH